MAASLMVLMLQMGSMLCCPVESSRSGTSRLRTDSRLTSAEPSTGNDNDDDDDDNDNEHRLTGETKLSATAGRLVITGKEKKRIGRLVLNFQLINNVFVVI